MILFTMTFIDLMLRLPVILFIAISYIYQGLLVKSHYHLVGMCSYMESLCQL